MELFRRFFYRKPPDRLLEISQRVYVFDCCLSSKVMEEDEYKIYMGGIVAQLQDYYPDSSFMAFNFREGDKKTQFSEILSQYDMTVMEYPRQYEGCPVLTLEMIHHFLRSCESWLSLEGQLNVLLLHCGRGGWPVLAFMLAALLLYRKQYSGELKTLEMVYKHAPQELLYLLTPLNSQPSQLRYLHYISRSSDWPPSDTPLTLDCIILPALSVYGKRPVVRIYGQDSFSTTSNRSAKLLFVSSIMNKRAGYHQPMKIDIHHRIQGDVILECIHMDEVNVDKEIIFRVMFHTAFVQANILMLTRDEVDVMRDAEDQISENFKAEVLFSDKDALPFMMTTEREFEDRDGTEILMTDHLLEISKRVYVLKGDKYKIYMGGIVAQLQDYYPDSSFMAFNFREGDKRTQFSKILSRYDITVMEYPQQYEGCPILPMEMICHFLRSSESRLSVGGQKNVVLLHCESGGWPVLAFMLSALLLYRKQYSGELKTLEMVYKHAPQERLYRLTPLNSQPSQLRYLHYISRSSDWPPSDTPLTLDCIILPALSVYGKKPVVRIYGQDYFSTTANRSSKLLFASSILKFFAGDYQREEYEMVKIGVHHRIQGDVILECINMEEINVDEEIIFRVMFHTAFVQANILMLSRDEVDVMRDARDQISENFKVRFSDKDALPFMMTTEREFEDGDGTEILMPEEFFETEEIFIDDVDGDPPPPPMHASPSPLPLPPTPPPPPPPRAPPRTPPRVPPSALSKLETLFSAVVPKEDSSRGGGRQKVTGSKTEKVHMLLVSDDDAKGQESQKFWNEFWEKVDATFIE